MLPRWDVARRRVLDVEPLIAHALEVARMLVSPSSLNVDGAPLDLALVHRALDGAARARLARLLSTSSKLARLVHVAIVDVIGRDLAREVQVQAFPFARVLGPGDAPAAVHTDAALGHALDERNVWLALTPAEGAAALQIRRFDGRGSDAVKNAAPLVAEPAESGDAFLFTPLHLHAGAVHDGDVTRVSVDVRVAPRKRPKSAPELGARFVPLFATPKKGGGVG